MRDIKFRAKRHKKETYWFYYDLIDDQRPQNEPALFNQHVMDIKTIGQFTGLKDKSGKEIYEGDILSETSIVERMEISSKQEVFWNKESADFQIKAAFSEDIEYALPLGLILPDSELYVIGNIHEQ